MFLAGTRHAGNQAFQDANVKRIGLRHILVKLDESVPFAVKELTVSSPHSMRATSAHSHTSLGVRREWQGSGACGLRGSVRRPSIPRLRHP